MTSSLAELLIYSSCLFFWFPEVGIQTGSSICYCYIQDSPDGKGPQEMSGSAACLNHRVSSEVGAYCLVFYSIWS